MQRRRFLRALPALGLAGLAGCTGGAGGDGGGDVAYDGYLDGVENFDGTADRTGQSTVTVMVGVQNGNAPYGFGPAAVRVSPGTTVVWEWTGEGGSHNVVAESGAEFTSPYAREEGETFEHTFDAPGVVKYYCAPHRGLGMKGVVEVVEG